MKGIIRNFISASVAVGFCASLANAQECDPMLQPVCSECPPCGGKINVGAEYLYWKSGQKDLLTVETEANSTDLSQNFRTHTIDFQYESGYRVLASYELPCNQWQIGATYTYAPGKGDLKLSTKADQTPIDFLYSTYQSKWESTFSYFDLDLARSYTLCECVIVRPHMGFRAIWGDQKRHSKNLLAEPFPIEGFPDQNSLPDNNKQEFTGYGIEAGVWGDWNVTRHISIIGHVGGSIVHTKLKYHTLESIGTVNGTFTPSSEFHTREVDHQAIPSLDLFLGLRYADTICNWDYSVYAGWESHVWFDLGNVELSNGGNFSTEGLTVGIDIGF